MDEQQMSSGTQLKEEKNNPLLIPGAILIAGVLIAGAIVYSNLQNGAGGKENNLAGAGTAPAALGDLSGNGPSLGDPSSPVTVVEFADFQCPFCGRFFQQTMPQIVEKYIKTGKVKFVYRDFAFLGEESEWASTAARCAGEQGKFWEYHDYLFSHQNGENEGAFAKKNLKKFAGTLGLNRTQFDSCLDSDKYAEEVQKDTAAGRGAGVSGTPTTFINGRSVVGAVPFAQIDAMIADALKKGK